MHWSKSTDDMLYVQCPRRSRIMLYRESYFVGSSNPLDLFHGFLFFLGRRLRLVRQVRHFRSRLLAKVPPDPCEHCLMSSLYPNVILHIGQESLLALLAQDIFVDLPNPRGEVRSTIGYQLCHMTPQASYG
jgi:hypothetical protein